MGQGNLEPGQSWAILSFYYSIAASFEVGAMLFSITYQYHLIVNLVYIIVSGAGVFATCLGSLKDSFAKSPS
jgi:hypothetical protein